MARDVALERSWRERLRHQQKSGLTIQQFCEQEGLVAHQFSWWRRELKRRAAESNPDKKAGTKRHRRAKQRQAAGDFVPVHVTPSPRTKAPIEIVLDQPVRIAVASGFDPGVLAEVVRVLETR